VYANVLGRPVLVPTKSVTSLGSAIFAFLAAGTFKTIEEAQDKICPPYRVYEPDRSERAPMTNSIGCSVVCILHSAKRKPIWRRVACIDSRVRDGRPGYVM
jgi:ribulose kinase